MTDVLFCARHYHGGQVALVPPCPWCRIEALEDALEAITATAFEVKRENTPEFMEWLKTRIDEAQKVWEIGEKKAST